MALDHYLDQTLAAASAIGVIPFDCVTPFTNALLDRETLRIRDAEPGERGLFEVADTTRSAANPLHESGAAYFTTTSRTVSASTANAGVTGGSRPIRQASISTIAGMPSGQDLDRSYKSATTSSADVELDAVLKAVTKLMNIYPMQDCQAHLEGLQARHEETQSNIARLEGMLAKHRREFHGADKENKESSLTSPRAVVKTSRQSIRPPGNRMSVAPGGPQALAKVAAPSSAHTSTPDLSEVIRKEELDILTLESMMADKQEARDKLDQDIRDAGEAEKERKRARDIEIAKENSAKQDAEIAQLQRGSAEINAMLEKEIVEMTSELQELEEAGSSRKRPIETTLKHLKSSLEQSDTTRADDQTNAVFKDILSLTADLESAINKKVQPESSREEDLKITHGLMQSILAMKLEPGTPAQTVLSAFLLSTLLDAPTQSVPLAQLKAAVGQQAEVYAAQAASAEDRGGYTLDAGIKALYGLVANRMITIDRSGREGIVKFV